MCPEHLFLDGKKPVGYMISALPNPWVFLGMASWRAMYFSEKINKNLKGFPIT